MATTVRYVNRMEVEAIEMSNHEFDIYMGNEIRDGDEKPGYLAELVTLEWAQNNPNHPDHGAKVIWYSTQNFDNMFKLPDVEPAE